MRWVPCRSLRRRCVWRRMRRSVNRLVQGHHAQRTSREADPKHSRGRTHITHPSPHIPALSPHLLLNHCRMNTRSKHPGHVQVFSHLPNEIINPSKWGEDRGLLLLQSIRAAWLSCSSCSCNGALLRMGAFDLGPLCFLFEGQIEQL